jgi:hypothetical protein
MVDYPAAPPGPTLADEMTRLDGLDDSELAEALQTAERGLRVAQALRAAAVSAVRDRVEAMGHRLSGATETVAAITVTSNRSAAHLMDTSLALCDRPAVWQALADGLIDAGRAAVIADGLQEVEGADRDRLQAKALAFAATHTAFQTRRYVSRLLIDHDPHQAERDRQRQRGKAWDKRHISAHGRAHGMADLYAYLPAGTATLLLDALDQIARTYPDDRTLEQKRVDALEQILADTVHIDVAVQVVIPADTLAGLQDSGASLDGSGPVDATHARYLALREDARWQRLITDPVHGTLTDLSTTAYRIPQAMKEFVRARDRRCRFPGCATPARHTDTDHLTAWPDGQTTPANLACESRGHHRTKTHSGWRVRCGPDGALIWTSPLGTEHTTWPHNYNQPTD